MTGYTIRNLKEVEDSAVKFGLSPQMESRFARTDLGAETLGLSYQRLAPSVRQPFGHRHEHQEEVYVVLSGGGRVSFDDEVVEVPGTLSALPRRRHAASRRGPTGWSCSPSGRTRTLATPRPCRAFGQASRLVR
jgi:hypothetical protein